MRYPQWLNFAPDSRATNTREPSGRSENLLPKVGTVFSSRVRPPLLIHRGNTMTLYDFVVYDMTYSSINSPTNNEYFAVASTAVRLLGFFTSLYRESVRTKFPVLAYGRRILHLTSPRLRWKL
jgi:hypothetical protein